MSQTKCESCLHYIYDEEMDYDYCEVDLDEDEMRHFITNTFENCPYFRLEDEYKIVRKQM